jgi:hypothetical protein
MTITNGFSDFGGVFDWIDGRLTFGTSQTFGLSQLEFLLGEGRRLGYGRSLLMQASAALNLNGALTVDGGELLAGNSLTNTSLLTIRDGLVRATLLTNDPSAMVVMENTGHLLVLASLVNNGTIQLNSPTAVISNAPIVNAGTIRGNGQVASAITNNAAGQIQTTTGDRLVFGGAISNSGSINAIGGEMQFNAPVTNVVSTGAITARDAIVRFNGNLTNNGSLGVSFGTADIFGDITNSGTGRIVVSGGSQATFYDDVVNNGTMNVSASGSMQSTAVFFGSLSGLGIAGGGRVFNEGDLRPGFSPGTMAFGGDLSFGPLASLDIEIGGTTPGTQFDRVTVASSVFLDGTLDVSTINGFSPTLPGQSFTIVTAGSLTGTFGDINGIPAPTIPGLFWKVTYTPTSAILSTSALPGDIDLDGDVDRKDAALFTPRIGLSVGSIWTTGDFNGDNATTLADLILLQANIGQSLPLPSPSASAVPEPSSFALLLPAIGWMFVRVRRARSRFAIK